MEWSHSTFGNAAKVGIALSLAGIATAFVLRNASEMAQMIAVVALIAIGFVASMALTQRADEDRRTHGGHHTVSHVPLHHNGQQAA